MSTKFCILFFYLPFCTDLSNYDAYLMVELFLLSSSRSDALSWLVLACTPRVRQLWFGHRTRRTSSLCSCLSTLFSQYFFYSREVPKQQVGFSLSLSLSLY